MPAIGFPGYGIQNNAHLCPIFHGADIQFRNTDGNKNTAFVIQTQCSRTLRHIISLNGAERCDRTVKLGNDKALIVICLRIFQTCFSRKNVFGTRQIFIGKILFQSLVIFHLRHFHVSFRDRIIRSRRLSAGPDILFISAYQGVISGNIIFEFPFPPGAGISARNDAHPSEADLARLFKPFPGFIDGNEIIVILFGIIEIQMCQCKAVPGSFHLLPGCPRIIKRLLIEFGLDQSLFLFVQCHISLHLVRSRIKHIFQFFLLFDHGLFRKDHGRCQRICGEDR